MHSDPALLRPIETARGIQNAACLGNAAFLLPLVGVFAAPGFCAPRRQIIANAREMWYNPFMIVTKDENGISVVGREFFDVADTLGCGQTFRFRSDGDGYVVRTADASCRVRQTADGARIVTDDPDRFYRYFALDEDYGNTTDGSVRFPNWKRRAKRERAYACCARTRSR